MAISWANYEIAFILILMDESTENFMEKELERTWKKFMVADELFGLKYFS